MVFMETTCKGTQWAGEVQKYLEWAKEFCRDVVSAMWILSDKAGHAAWERCKNLKFRFSFVDYFCGGISFLMLGFAVLVAAAGAGILAYQVSVWLFSGNWTEMPLLAVFDYLFRGTVLHQWLESPVSWLGLHQIVKWLLVNVPLSLVLIVNGIAGMAGMLGVIIAALSVRIYQFNRGGK